MTEQTPGNQNSDANNSINCLANASAGIATQQRPQVSTNTLTFDVKNENFEHLADVFHTMLKMQQETTEAMKNNPFQAYLR